MSNALGSSQNLIANLSGVPSIALQSLRPVKTLPDAAYTFTQADSGAIFLISTVTAARTYTLPMIAGMWFDVSVNVAPAANTITFTSAGGANTIHGTTVTATSNAAPTIPTLGGSVVANASLATAANASIGDRYSFFCDGNRWSVLGLCATQNKAATSAWA